MANLLGVFDFLRAGDPALAVPGQFDEVGQVVRRTYTERVCQRVE